MKRRMGTLRYVIPIVIVALLLLLPSVAGARAGSVGPGLYETKLLTNKNDEMGTVKVWNSPKKLMVKVEPMEGWAIRQVMVYAGYPDLNPIPAAKNGNPIPGKFPFTKAYKVPTTMHQLTLDLKEDLGFSWGATSSDYRFPTIAVHAQLYYLDGNGRSGAQQRVWAYGPDQFDGSKFGWTFDYQLAHPMRGHFVDAPVGGLGFATPSNSGLTDEAGSFDYFPGERVDLWVGNVYLGQAETGKKISPLDIFMADVEDPRVTNVARLLQSMDADGNPQGGIDIRPSVGGCLNTAAANLAVDPGNVNWSDDGLVDALIAETHEMCAGNPEATLVVFSAEQAQQNLTDGISASGIYRKNVTKTAEWGESNQQIEVMPVYFPGYRSNGDPSLCVDVNGDRLYNPDEGDALGVAYEEYRLYGESNGEECDPRNYDDEETCRITLIECRDVAKPLAVSYLGEIDIFDDDVTTEFWDNRFAHDLHVAVSRDDGATWKRMNVSRMADLSSFDLETGEPFPGTVRSPQMKVNDNHILAVWTSTYARGGNPRYAINLCDDPDTPEAETPETGCAVYCSRRRRTGYRSLRARLPV